MHRHVCGARALIVFGLAVALSSTVGASRLAAQEGDRWFLEGRGGATFPMDDLADLAIEDQAPSFGIGIGYRLSPRFALKADGDLVLFSGETEDDDEDGLPGPSITGVDMRFLHYTVGVDFELTPPGRGRWDVLLQAGAGATTWDTDTFASPSGQTDFTKTYATLRGGLTLGYELSDRAALQLRSQVFFVFASEQDTRVLAPLLEPEIEADDDDDPASDEEEFIGTTLSVPIYFGIRIKL